MTDPRRGEHGQSSALVLAVLAFALLVAVGAVTLAVAVTDRARAQAAADATALAVAASGPRAGEVVARENGATIERVERLDADIRTTVRVGAARATARARWVPVPIP